MKSLKTEAKFEKRVRKRRKPNKKALGDLTNALPTQHASFSKKFKSPDFVKPNPRSRRAKGIRQDTPARYPDDPLKSLLKYNGPLSSTRIVDDPTQMWKCANVSTPSPLTTFSLVCHARASPHTPRNLNDSMTSQSSLDESPTTAFFQTLSRSSKAAEKRFKRKRSDLLKRKANGVARAAAGPLAKLVSNSGTVSARNSGAVSARNSSVLSVRNSGALSARNSSAVSARKQEDSEPRKKKPTLSEHTSSSKSVPSKQIIATKSLSSKSVPSKSDASFDELLSFSGTMQIPKLKVKPSK